MFVSSFVCGQTICGTAQPGDVFSIMKMAYGLVTKLNCTFMRKASIYGGAKQGSRVRAGKATAAANVTNHT